MDSSSDESDDRVSTSVEAVTARRRFAMLPVTTRNKRVMGRKTKPNRKDRRRHVCRKGHRNFKKMYRLNLWSFKHVPGRMRHQIETVNTTKAQNLAGYEIFVEIRLALKLRILLVDLFAIDKVTTRYPWMNSIGACGVSLMQLVVVGVRKPPMCRLGPPSRPDGSESGLTLRIAQFCSTNGVHCGGEVEARENGWTSVFVNDAEKNFPNFARIVLPQL